MKTKNKRRQVISAIVFSPKCQVIEIEQALYNGNDEFLEVVNSIFMRNLCLVGNEHRMFIKKSHQTRLLFFSSRKCEISKLEAKRQ